MVRSVARMFQSCRSSVGSPLTDAPSDAALCQAPSLFLDVFEHDVFASFRCRLVHSGLAARSQLDYKYPTSEVEPRSALVLPLLLTRRKIGADKDFLQQSLPDANEESPHPLGGVFATHRSKKRKPKLLAKTRRSRSVAAGKSANAIMNWWTSAFCRN